MLWIKDVCLKKLRKFPECSPNLRSCIGTPNASVVIAICKHHGEERNLNSNFELQDVSKFRKASRELLSLTGTPSLCNLKFECKHGMCWKSQSLQTFASVNKILCIRVLVLELPTQWFKAFTFDDCHVNPRLQRMFSLFA